MLSTAEPISFTVTAAVTAPTAPANWIKVNHASGVAYTWGTPMVVSFTQAVFDSAAVGDALDGYRHHYAHGRRAIEVDFTITLFTGSSHYRIFPSETPAGYARCPAIQH